MKIACLQFAPKVGDLDNNLNRADAVLNRADPLDLDELDLLVLPELAFTGYNFGSLREITPFLEHCGSGISSLWARTTALKYNCVVSVGYPERADVAKIWPTGPEYYNSAIVVNGDGETTANYRKAFLFPTDETWALEGKEGFYHDEIPQLGSTVMGICMDLNPYRFEAPWNAFEFGFHILNVNANLVIVSMAWMTREDSRLFTRQPQEPDMESLTYWVQRLEPLIRAERSEEVVIVFCNRCGSEGDALYCGTSAVVGIKDGEVLVYGLLGRGNKELLVVDTDLPPFAKLVQKLEIQPDMPNSAERGTRRGSVSSSAVDSVAESSAESQSASTAPTSMASPGLFQSFTPPPPASVLPEQAATQDPLAENKDDKPKKVDEEQPAVSKPESLKPESLKPEVPKIETSVEMNRKKRAVISPSTPSAMSPLSNATMSPLSPVSVSSMTSTSTSGRKKPRPKSPKIQIPYTPSLDEISSAPLSATSSNFSIAGSMVSPAILTPSQPSPVPHHLRPKLGSIPPSPSVYEHKATPFPGEEAYFAEAIPSPTTPFFGISDTPVSPIFPRFPVSSRNPTGRKDTPIEPGYSPFSPWSPWSASTSHSARPTFKPLTSQLAISAMMSQFRSPVATYGGRTPKPGMERADLPVETPSTAVPLTAQPLTAVPLTAVPVTAVPATAVPTQFPYTFPDPPASSWVEDHPDPVKDRSRTPKASERPMSPPKSMGYPASPPRDQSTPKASPKASYASLAKPLYPPIPDPITRPQTSTPIRNVKSDDELMPKRARSSSRGIIPIVASPSIFDHKFGRSSVSLSEPGARGGRVPRSQSQQPRCSRNERERRGRSRSLVDARSAKLKANGERVPSRSASTSPRAIRV